MTTTAPVIHEESVRDTRSRVERLLERIRHRHYVIRSTWTLDNSPWSTDPNALDFCECGARKRMWGGGWMDA